MTEPNRAVPELVDLLAAMRPDWPPPPQLQGLIANAATSGLSWPQVVVGLVRLAVDPDAMPAELLPTHTDWRSVTKRPPADPNANTEYQQARSAITRKREQ